MHNRLRLLQLATALLYLGPLLAGLMGQGWAMAPVFALIFVVWSVILRPHLWPATLADFARSEALVALGALIATQALLVVVSFGVGRGIGGVLGVKPALPEFLPLALSFLSVPLSRLIWNPLVVEANIGFDPLLHRAEPVADQAREMLAQVMALPDEVSAALLQQHLTAIAVHLDAAAIRQGLGGAVAGGEASRAAIRALIVHATDPAVNQLLAGSGYPAQAFAAAGRDGELLTLFAGRCMVALADAPKLVVDCPTVAAVSGMAQAVSEPAAAALARLARVLGQARAV